MNKTKCPKCEDRGVIWQPEYIACPSCKTWTRKPIINDDDYYFFAECHRGEWIITLSQGWRSGFKPNTESWRRSQKTIDFPKEPTCECVK